VLQDRFGLRFHRETHNLKAYTLVIANGRSKLKESDPNKTSSPDVDAPDVPSGTGIMRMMPTEFIGRRVRIANLTDALSLVVDKTVVDETGLTGKYDFDMKWEPDRAAGLILRGPDGNGPPPEFDPVAPGTGSSIFTALQEQLGLKLVTKKVPVDVIVIDHIDPPSPN
jgi:uncharacterized protein (TIGR03435 family)